MFPMRYSALAGSRHPTLTPDFTTFGLGLASALDKRLTVLSEDYRWTTPGVGH
jgi:hypothetical protein